MKNRVVVTGLGVLSPIGNGKDEFLHALLDGKSGIEEITSFDTTNYRTSRGGEIKDFNFNDYNIDLKEDGKNLGKATQLVLVSANEALKDAGFKITKENSHRVGIILGSSEGETHCMDQFIDQEINNKNDKSDYQLILKIPTSNIYKKLAQLLGVKGPCASIATACAAGTNAVGYAFDLIRYGVTDAVVAGGVDLFSRLSFSGFNALMSVTRNECKPFNEQRDGMILGEASAILILENLEKARSRGAHIYAEVLGYGICNDAYHITSPDPDGGGAERAIMGALNDANLTPQNINYINAHGTGTQANDIMEARVIKRIFYESSTNNVPISSSKAMIGHTLGAAGSIELIICILAINHGFLPPTINFAEPISGFEDIDFIPNSSRPAQIELALSNSFAFAGNTSAIVVGKYTDS